MKVLRAAVILLSIIPTFPTLAGDCPADRPIKRSVIDYSQPVTCTLLACGGQLRCPEDDGPCVYSGWGNDCNKCSGPVTIEACFSRAEIDLARER